MVSSHQHPPSRKRTILIVEDEKDLVDLLAYNLEAEGFGVLKAFDGVSGLEKARAEFPDLIVLDLNLPEMHGHEVYRQLSEDASLRQIPVMMMAARGMLAERIEGLSLGADDFLPKPFSPLEFVLRVQAILRRVERASVASDFTVGPMRFDKGNFQCFLDDEPLDLTKTELKLLSLFLERHGEPVERAQLLRDVWGNTGDVHSRTLDTHVKRLRGKLGQYSCCLETIRNVGYRLDLECDVCEAC